MVTCTAIASGILLANLLFLLPFPPQDAVQLGINKLVPFAQIVSRGGILFEMGGVNAMQAEIFESVTQHLSRRLGGIALAPILHAQPIAQFGVLMRRVDAETDATDLASVDLTFTAAQRDGQPDLAGFLRQKQEVPRILLGIGMCDSQCGSCYFARADERKKLGDIFVAIGPQPQPCGFKCGSHVQSARANAMPPRAAARQSRLLQRMLISISPHWPCSKNDIVSKA